MFHVRRHHVQQRGVIPNVFVVTGDQESPSGRECEVFHDLWSETRQVLDVHWFEEVRICRKLLASPDVPPVVSPSGGCRRPCTGTPSLTFLATPAFKPGGDANGCVPFLLTDPLLFRSGHFRIQTNLSSILKIDSSARLPSLSRSGIPVALNSRRVAGHKEALVHLSSSLYRSFLFCSVECAPNSKR